MSRRVVNVVHLHGINSKLVGFKTACGTKSYSISFIGPGN